MNILRADESRPFVLNRYETICRCVHNLILDKRRASALSKKNTHPGEFFGMKNSVVKRVPLPMGDTYLVTKQGKMFHGVRHLKNGTTRPPTCTTYSMWTINEYIETARQADLEALRGKNPYVSKTTAEVYRDA